METIILNHRCEGSVRARASIRYERYPYSNNGLPQWVQYRHDMDFDWDWEGQSKVGEIKFCPYCGVELQTLLGGD